MSISLLRTMMLIRRFETVLDARPDHGFQLYSTGEEGVAAGVCAALREGDQLLSSGRAIGPALARGLSPGAVMAEVLGRTGGPCRGRGGRGHLAQPSRGFFGAHAVVAGNIAIAAGVAMAAKGRGRGEMTACLFGDGACGAGVLYETLNIAALWRLPILFVCDNNGYAISTPASKGVAAERLADLARPFGMPAETVDGMDAPAVAVAATRLAQGVRSDGPAFLECVSERLATHSTATRETRSPAEMAAAQARCPIRRLTEAMLASGALTQAALAALEAEVAAEVAAAVAFAEASPAPDPADVLADV